MIAYRMTVKQFRLLDAIVRHNSFSLAANEMLLSQPAISLQVKTMERIIGAPLFEKSNSQVYLTDVGQIVLDTARTVLHDLKKMNNALDELTGEVAGSLDIAVVTSAKYFLPSFLGEFLQTYPKVTPSLTVTNQTSMLEALSKDRHNLYIMGQIPKRIKMQSRPFLENILEVVTSPEHPLAQKENVSLMDLAKERFLVREKGSGTRKAVGKVFSEENIYIKPYMELGDTGAIKNAVMANLGIAVLSRHAIEIEHDIGKIAILDVQDFPLHGHWYAVYPREKSLSLVTKTFLDFLMTKQTISHELMS